MPIATDSLNRKLYDLLNSKGYNPVPKDSDVNNAGKTVAPEEADVFKFTFTVNGEPVDDAWVSIDGAENLTLYYDSSIANAGDSTNFNDSWYGFLRFLKKWAHARQLSFKLEPKDRINSDMAQRTYMRKKEEISEGYYPMGKAASYNDAVPTVKIILQHTRQIQEGEQRYRNIAKIFLENTEGERILAPTTKPGIAQVYARHIAEGGLPNDERWNHLKSICEEYSKMAGFVRAVRNNQFNESAQQLVNEGLNHYQSLRETLHKLRGSRGYNSYFESWTPTLNEDETDESSLNELFVQETLDPRIESVMPILSKLNKTLGEAKEVSELDEWANDVVGEATEAGDEQGVTEGTIGDIVRTVSGVVKKVGPSRFSEKPITRPITRKYQPARDNKNPNPSKVDVQKAIDQVSFPSHPAIARKDPKKGVAEANWGSSRGERNSFARGASSFKRGEHSAEYRREQEAARAEQARQARVRDLEQNGTWYVRENGLLVRDEAGEPIPYTGVDAANKAAGQLIKDPSNAGKKYTLTMKPQDPTNEVEESLDADQKRVGQLGPTEKVKNNNIGKLVGASESVEQDLLDDIKRLIG